MDARQIRFTDLIKADAQLKIPVYQRTYDWKKEQCKQLFDDILNLIKRDIHSHFIGSIVYIEQGLYHLGSTNQFLVVDGQQRITTLLLIFAAIEEIAKESDKLELAEQIRKQCLINEYVNNPDHRTKLVLSRTDNDIFQKIIKHEKVEKRTNLTNNYEYLKGLLIDNKDKFSLDEFYQTICNKVIIVSIALDRSKDNAQLIFESLNATGIDLTSGDLIRNFLLMNLDDADQDNIYNEYWYPFQESLKHRLTVFFLDYIYMKKGTTTNIKEKHVYKEFKSYFFDNFTHDNIKEVVSDLLKYSKYWLKILNAKDDDPLIDSGLKRLSKTESLTYYPFLMRLYDEFSEGRLSSEEFFEILKIIESFIVRRNVCHVPTNSLNSIFRPMFNNLDHQNLKNSLIKTLKTEEFNRRWPDDLEFKQALINNNLYHNYNIRRLILEELEKFNNKEVVDMKNLTIEHIMPQSSGDPENLPANWKKMLGNNWKEVYETWIHSLGNITLTGYNPEYSDSDFEVKKSRPNGLKESGLKLNQEISKEQSWNEDTIKSRAERLSNIAIQIWIY